ncbi:MAG: hypothetical protein QOJ56_3056 [Mycobacterium sp.]|jgi:hypothetical protein|nr:hypothetical protein [Mycobacterium sp.]
MTRSARLPDAPRQGSRDTGRDEHILLQRGGVPQCADRARHSREPQDDQAAQRDTASKQRALGEHHADHAVPVAPGTELAQRDLLRCAVGDQDHRGQQDDTHELTA